MNNNFDFDLLSIEKLIKIELKYKRFEYNKNDCVLSEYLNFNKYIEDPNLIIGEVKNN